MSILYGERAEIATAWCEWALANGDDRLCPPFKSKTKTHEVNPMTNTNSAGELTLESIIDFGKHKGKQIEDMLDDEPGYIKWMVEGNIRPFDEETMEAISKRGIA